MKEFCLQVIRSLNIQCLEMPRDERILTSYVVDHEVLLKCVVDHEVLLKCVLPQSIGAMKPHLRQFIDVGNFFVYM
uniref:Uncharacterized protein n=1 Tax=Cucumis melo TaxID=3656 RepID=A0A9I9EDF0_CUCME